MGQAGQTDKERRRDRIDLNLNVMNACAIVERPLWYKFSFWFYYILAYLPFYSPNRTVRNCVYCQRFLLAWFTRLEFGRADK